MPPWMPGGGPESSSPAANGAASAIFVVRGVVAAQPADELGVRVRAPARGDFLDVGGIERELDDQPVRVGSVQRAAIAVVELEDVGLAVAGLAQPLGDRGLRLAI